MENQDVVTPDAKVESRELAEKSEGVKYPHLCLRDWPFQTVPDERFTRIWADRRDVLETVYSILNYLSRRKPSTINLIWAWFGTGKSHTLKHMAHLCETKFKSLLPIYTEYPKTARSFLDLYKHFISEIAGKLDPSLLLEHGIGKNVETSDDAVKSIACIVRMLELSGRCDRIIWMIDEFQRIGSERTDVSEDINTGLHSVYNASPNSFSIFLSFSIKDKEMMFKYLSKELIDRIGVQKIIEIPRMDGRDAFTFISDLLYEFRPDPEKVPSTFYPFEDEAVKYIIALIENTSELKPRSIMQYFNAVLEAADMPIALGQLKSIDLEFAKKILTATIFSCHSSGAP